MCILPSSRLRSSLAVSLILCGAVAATNCAVEDLGPSKDATAGSAGSGGSSGSGGSGGATGGSAGSTGGSGGATGGSAGNTGGSGGATGGSAGNTGGSGGSTGGSAGSTGGSAGSTADAGTGGSAGSGGAGGADAGTGGSSGSAGSDGGVSPEAAKAEGGGGCSANKAVSFDKNVAGRSDPAKAHVELDFAGSMDLPTGNSKRTIEFWAFVLKSSWAADANTLFFYGGDTRSGGTAGGFGLDFGTPGSIDPFVNLPDLDNDNQATGLSSSMDQWAHFAMTWDGTNVRAYVNGVQKASKMSAGKMLTTVASVVTVGGYGGDFFNGAIDELRIWNVDRSAADITGSMNKPLVGNEAGLTAYYKFDEGTGTSAADSVTSASHTAHNGTLKAASSAQVPTWIAGAPLMCP